MNRRNFLKAALGVSVVSLVGVDVIAAEDEACEDDDEDP